MTPKPGKKKRIGLLLFVAVCAAISFGLYISRSSLFLNGLEKLPDKPCDGAMRAATAKEILPDAREAVDSELHRPPGRDFAAFCRIKTSERSVLSTHADMHDSDLVGMRDWFKGQRAYSGKVIALGHNIEAQSGTETTAVYFPCTPRQSGADASDSYILSVESRILGKSRNKGAELRKGLTEIAIQSAERAHYLAQCKEPLDTMQLDDSMFR